MKFILLTILTIFCFFPSLKGQTIRYDVIKGSKNLGEMIVNRTLTSTTEEISFESDVTFKLLFSFNLTYMHYEKFLNGKLQWGKAKSMLSGRVQKNSKIVANESGYRLTLDGINASIENGINYSVSQIYFTEPTDGQKVFSQQFGQFMTFEKVGEHKYLMSSPDGDNYYTYLNGICVDVRVQRDFANFNFVMQPQSLLAVESKADSLNNGSN